jgi:hypothetical protein
MCIGIFKKQIGLCAFVRSTDSPGVLWVVGSGGSEAGEFDCLYLINERDNRTEQSSDEVLAPLGEGGGSDMTQTDRKDRGIACTSKAMMNRK